MAPIEGKAWFAIAQERGLVFLSSGKVGLSVLSALNFPAIPTSDFRQNAAESAN